jgi:hypothetical protein
MNTIVLSGPVKRRAELAGDIENACEALRKMVLALESLDAMAKLRAAHVAASIPVSDDHLVEHALRPRRLASATK